MIQYILGALSIASAIFAPPWAEYQGTAFVVGLGFLVWGLLTQPDKDK
jgi:hypothetical protein